MEITQTGNGERGRFKAEENGVEAGLMTYVHSGEKRIIIDHTEVDPDFSGQGIGRSMVAAAVEYARKNELKILPLCPFAKSVFNKTPEFADVLV
ncbi:MAG: N-acetyltransferase [Prevotellaceae bacterium]|jgi:predicted GNAT family acetyltransferase|nr:N-acetyltransferase [Prevotellaceae bacterium]